MHEIVSAILSPSHGDEAEVSIRIASIVLLCYVTRDVLR